jgi:hypothetical protein
MHNPLANKVNEALRRLTATEPCPDIRWHDVVRIEAWGHDTPTPFEIAVGFTYSEGTDVWLHVHHKGYDEIIESLPSRFPSISPTWFSEMSSQPCSRIERVLYSQDEPLSSQ